MTLFQQAAACALLLILTLWLQCAGVAALIEWLKRIMARDIYAFGSIRAAALVVQTTVAMIVLHSLVILLWAGFYRWRCFPSWQLAFYFSGSTYSTVGYGDVLLSSKWRLLGPLESMTGVLMCGVSVSILFAVVTRLVDAQDPQKTAHSRASN
jgi:hypothetical protein